VNRSLAGRVVIVTGVTAGIGRATAVRLLAAGATVVGCARDAERLRAVTPELPGLVPVRCDVRDRLDRESLVDGTLQRYGRVDVLVSNAGLGYVGRVVEMTADDVERVMGTNAVGPIDLTRLVLPGMLARRDGDLLFVSSGAVWLTTPPLTVYSASQHGVDGFVQGLRREVAGGAVRVHSVNPGFVATEFLARAVGYGPREGDPDVRPAPGVDPDRVARVVERELRSGRGRTVAVPRVIGLGRVLGLPPLSHAVDLGTRLASGPLVRLARRLAADRTPGADAR
jgi:NAD(P)-dependent dehydrogenase (short-subunit alcohol dehydrogenase family)